MLAPQRASRDSPLSLFPVTGFGGLNLVDDPQEVGFSGAIDLVNVDLAQSGRVGSRAGFASVSTPSSGRTPIALMPLPDPTGGGADYLYYSWSDGTNVGVDYMRYASGGSVGTWAAASAEQHSWVRAGTPAGSTIYLATNNSQLRKFSPSTLATAPGKPRYVTVQSPDNRLVQAGFAQLTDSPTAFNGSVSTVFFSDPGAMDTYSANNYVHLAPGDGEIICGVCTWRDLLFVFKETAMFVFYGNSTDSTGATVFNYRRVSLPSTMGAYGSKLAVATPDGVFVLCSDGLYRTTGGDLTEVSRPVRPLFRSPQLAALPFSSLVPEYMPAYRTTLTYANGMIVIPGTGTSSLIFRPETGQWSVWSGFLSSICDSPFVSGASAGTIGDYGYGVYGLAAGASYATNKIVKLDPTATTDVGAAFTARYRTGFSDLGIPEAEKLLREVLVDSSGTVTVKTAFNDGTLDSGKVVAGGRVRRGYRGRNFSVELSGSGAWQVSRLACATWDQRPPQERST